MPSTRVASVVRMAELSPSNLKPTSAVRSVTEIQATAASRCEKYDSVRPSGSGTRKPALLSNGSPDSDSKRKPQVNFGYNAALIALGARLRLRGPARLGPTDPLLSMPIAIDCVSAKPVVGE